MKGGGNMSQKLFQARKCNSTCWDLPCPLGLICPLLCFLTLIGCSWAYGTPDTTAPSIPVVQWLISVSGGWHRGASWTWTGPETMLKLSAVCPKAYLALLLTNRTMPGIMMVGLNLTVQKMYGKAQGSKQWIQIFLFCLFYRLLVEIKRYRMLVIKDSQRLCLRLKG